MCRPAISRPAGASAISARASSGANPNFEPAWPVRIASCVSASTPGVTRSRTRCDRPPSSSASRSASSPLSSTTVPTPASTAIASSARDFALPCR